MERIEELSQELVQELLLVGAADYIPRLDRVLIKPLRRKKYKSEVVYTEHLEESREQWGLVIAVGPGNISPKGVRIPPDVEPGQTVVMGGFVGEEITIDGVVFRLVKHNDLQAIIG